MKALKTLPEGAKFEHNGQLFIKAPPVRQNGVYFLVGQELYQRTDDATWVRGIAHTFPVETEVMPK
jgi:hypothetical protein